MGRTGTPPQPGARQVAGFNFGGVIVALVVGCLAFGGVDVVNLLIHSAPVSPFFAALNATIGTMPGFVAGLAGYVTNRVLGIGRMGNPRIERGLWGAAAAALVILVALILFVNFYAQPPIPVVIWIWVAIASVGMFAAMLLAVPGRVRYDEHGDH